MIRSLLSLEASMPREKEEVEEVMGPALYTTSSLDAILPNLQGADFFCQRSIKNNWIINSPAVQTNGQNSTSVHAI